jgi:ubiquitin C-terminal hydrolase
MMKLPIPGGDSPGSRVPTMTECITAAFESENINEYACDVCKKRTDAIITTKIARLPTILILSFKRFTNTGAKINGQVDWNLDHLDFTKWMAFSRSPYTDSSIYPIYETFSVIEHMGSSRGGHYRMYAQSDEEWTEYDDCSVRKVDVKSVISPSSYIMLLTPVEMKKQMADMIKQSEKTL